MDMARDNPARDESNAVALLRDIVRDLAAELHPGRTVAPSLDARLDRDLAFDSLARMELLARLERGFRRAIPEQVVIAAKTPRDLLPALALAPELPQMEPARVALTSVPVGVPSAAETLNVVLEWHARADPGRVHVRFYRDVGEGEVLRYGELWDEARGLARRLRQQCAPGERIAIMLPTGRAYFVAFYGVLLAGAVPVSLYPPVSLDRIEEYLSRQAAILRNCAAVLLIAAPEVQMAARLLHLHVDSLRAVTTVAVLQSGSAVVGPDVSVAADDIAFLQYTSGSTGDPKGVVLTHANVLANIRAMNGVIEARPDDVFVSWLPLYHDMGLIGAWLGSLYTGMPLVVMSPLSFLARPRRWLEAIHRYRGTLSAAPNFAYALCVRHISDADAAGLDLSQWRIAFNGAEPVSADTIEAFTSRFAPQGLRSETMYPVYGLAEAGVGLAFPPPGRAVRVDRVAREVYMREARAVPAQAQDDAARWIACGRALPGHEIRIVDVAGRVVPARHEGRVQFRGPSATRGYFRNPERTRALFDGDWLETGDRGYVAEGDLFVTGRSKDLIIRAGRNIYPQELEDAAGAVPGVRKGCVAAFAQADPTRGTERLVLLVETRLTGERERVVAQVNAAVSRLIGDPPDEVVLVPPHTVPKTSSGKIRRAASREVYAHRAWHRRRPLWHQALRLAMGSAIPALRGLVRRLAAFAYGAYAWAGFGALAPVIWLIGVIGPRRYRWSMLHRIGRALAAVMGIRLVAVGADDLPGQCIFVANHASYLDVFVLVSVLPRPVRFVAKAELERIGVVHAFLRGLDTEFVERFDTARGIRGARRLIEAARGGAALLFFAEGTFTRAPGVMPFHLGAFVAAVEAQVPLVPIAIAGTRVILPDGSWWPRRGAVTITFGAPIAPARDRPVWPAALALRDAARAHIVRLAGEPDLARS